MNKLLKILKHSFVPHRGNAYRPHAFRHKALSLYSVGLILSQVLFGITMYSGPVLMGGDNKAVAKNIVKLSNVKREQSQLSGLYENETLSRAAEVKLKDMFEKGYWDHTGPNGETAWDFIKTSGYQYALAGENLARGFTSSTETVEAWMASPTHKANILNNRFREIGVAVGSGKLRGAETTVVVQFFGEPKTAFASAASAEVAGSKEIIPELSLENVTLPSKNPYFIVWIIILGLIMIDGVMIRRLSLHASKSHIFNFRISLLLSISVLVLLSFGFAGIA